MGGGYKVDIGDLETYTNNLGYYTSEADKFGKLVDQADVSNESWGLIGLYCKESYTQKLGELRELLADMREGVETLTDKMSTATKVYKGMEDDTAMSFGSHETTIDGPR